MGAAAGQDPTPREGGGGGSTDPKMIVWVNGFCGHQRCRRFCFGHMAGGELLFSPHVSILKMLRILWKIQKWVKNTKKI